MGVIRETAPQDWNACAERRSRKTTGQESCKVFLGPVCFRILGDLLLHRLIGISNTSFLFNFINATICIENIPDVYAFCITEGGKSPVVDVTCVEIVPQSFEDRVSS